jgi:LysM repeat protein
VERTPASQTAAQPTPPAAAQPAERTGATQAQAQPTAPAAAQSADTSGATRPAIQPSAPEAAARAATSGGPFRAYRVQPGDTVKLIAQTYGVSIASIAQASGLRNADQLRVGQLLTIPSQPGYLYRVQPGETLDQIAARTGVATENIIAVSDLPAATVRAGDVILIPERAITPRK